MIVRWFLSTLDDTSFHNMLVDTSYLINFTLYRKCIQKKANSWQIVNNLSLEWTMRQTNRWKVRMLPQCHLLSPTVSFECWLDDITDMTITIKYMCWYNGFYYFKMCIIWPCSQIYLPVLHSQCQLCTSCSGCWQMIRSRQRERKW